MKKATRASLILAVILLAALTSGAAYAQRVRFGVFLGIPGPWWYPAPYYYYPPAYSYPPAVAVQSAPTYIERSPAQAAPPQGIWYYCTDAKAYYPYVRECPGGWQHVPAGPPPRQAAR
jgi:hypothetical protein